MVAPFLLKNTGDFNQYTVMKKQERIQLIKYCNLTFPRPQKPVASFVEISSLSASF